MFINKGEYMEKLTRLFDEMWVDYLEMTPLAGKVVKILENEEQKIVNDHIALRTVDLQNVNIDVLEKKFLEYGMTCEGEYHFPEKKLYARHYERAGYPKVFISQLILSEMPSFVRELMEKSLENINEISDSFYYSGRKWDLSFSDYQKVYKESEYAAWLLAIGYRPNHFTINVNALTKFPKLKKLNEFLLSKKIALNTSGGEIKGSPEQYLEQSSTLADKISVQFTDGEFEVPSCYFEFAKRYPQSNGKLFEGFVATNADKIFESTNIN